MFNLRFLFPIVRGFRIILLVVGVLWIIGCGEGGSDLYPGAPIVSIRKTDFNSDTGYLKYRLEVQEPLPYNIVVKLEQTQHATKEDKEKISDTLLEPAFPVIRMQMGRSVDGNLVYVRNYTSLTVSILPWDGLGDAPYNVGSPNSLTVKRFGGIEQ